MPSGSRPGEHDPAADTAGVPGRGSVGVEYDSGPSGGRHVWRAPSAFQRSAHDGKAGASPMRQYRTMRKTWRKRIRRRLVSVGGLAFVVGVLPLQLWAMRHPGTFYVAGAALGAWISLIVSLSETAHDYIERWQTGAWGEQWTAKQLRPLQGEGWTILHDRRSSYDKSRAANFDHIVIGPDGVFLIDTKRWRGQTTIENGRPTLRRTEDPQLPASVFEGIPGQARATAVRLRDAIRVETRASVWVQAVVVIWATFRSSSSTLTR